MTILSAANTLIVGGNGSQTVFSFPFVGVTAGDISVTYSYNGSQASLTQGPGSGQFQVSFNTPVPPALWSIGGMVTYNPGGTPIPNGSSLTITRTIPLEQTVSLQNEASFGQYASAVEQALDLLEMQIQQVNSAVASSAPVPSYGYGPWTPTIATTGTVGTPAYTSQIGSFEQIGRQFTARFYIGVSAWSGSPTGNVVINGLPGMSANLDVGHCFFSYTSGLSLASSFYSLSGLVNNGTSSIQVYKNGPFGSAALTVAEFVAPGTLAGACFFHN